MANNSLQKKLPNKLKEKGQYVIAFGVIAAMLLAVGFPVFVIFFFGVFAYFLWKIFSSTSRNETREIFEFYLAANEILRDDERRWFGFEIREVIDRGERILQSMTGAPPLVYFALGALYNKTGAYETAVSHLAYIYENENADESTYVLPSNELRNYVRILRKIEREPAEAPLTSAAVRALERARKNRGHAILEDSRSRLSELNRQRKEGAAERNRARLKESTGVIDAVFESDAGCEPASDRLTAYRAENGKSADLSKSEKEEKSDEAFADRKPISEVLHDIYDSKVQ